MVAKDLRLIGPTMEQPQYNMFHRDKVEVEYKQIYQTVGLGTTIWSPLCSGVLTDKYLGQFPKGTRLGMEGLEWLKERSLSPQRLEKTQQLNEIALELNTSLAKLAIAWCVNNPNVSTVILGASKIKHLKETLSSLEVVPLITAEISERIEGILDNKPLHPMF